MSKPLILVTNDDGITAPGIANLIGIARKLGDVLVVAPDSPQSGQGHAITIEHPLRLHKTNLFGDIEAYECTGTPVDCVKLAKQVLAKDRKIDLCVSGVNHGSNQSINIIYSGTMSAAMEASLEGIDSIGFSLLDYQWGADFSHCLPYMEELMAYALENGLPNTKLLNVNFPMKSEEPLKGFKICRQAEARWVEDFAEGTDPRGRTYYWLTGRFVNEDTGTDTDVWALENNYISVVPSGHDLTVHAAIEPLSVLESLKTAS